MTRVRRSLLGQTLFALLLIVPSSMAPSASAFAGPTAHHVALGRGSAGSSPVIPQVSGAAASTPAAGTITGSGLVAPPALGASSLDRSDQSSKSGASGLPTRSPYSGADSPAALAANTTWAELRSGTLPPVRSGATMTYDGADGYALLFGGENGTGVLNDTWRFAGGRWTPVISAADCFSGFVQCPPPRMQAGMVYDPALKAVVLFGGYGGVGAWSGSQSDTWTFRGGVWTASVATGPSIRERVSMAFDDATQSVILFGGERMLSPGVRYFTNDTWSFNGTAWARIIASTFCQTAPCPPPRGDASFVYDPFLRADLLYGGRNATTVFGDSWRFSGGAWVRESATSPPGPRAGSLLTYDNATAHLLLFGGLQSASARDAARDTWELGNGTWTNRTGGLGCTNTTCPSPRYLSAFAYDPLGRYVVMAGGDSNGSYYSVPRNDTWLWLTPPLATATVRPSPTDVGQVVQFNASGSAGVPPYRYLWAFGDGARSALAAVGHAYGRAGLYTAGVWLNDTIGEAAGAAVTVTVSDLPALRSIRASSSAVDVGQLLTVSANLSNVGSGNDSAAWTFSPSLSCPSPTGLSVSCRAASPDATAWAALTVADSHRGTVAGRTTLRVDPDPQVSRPDASRGSADVGQGVRFSVAVQGGSGRDTFAWDTPAAGCDEQDYGALNCSFREAGNLSVSVNVTDSNGFTAQNSTAVPFRVYWDPVPRAPSLSERVATVGDTVRIDATVWGGAGDNVVAWIGLPGGCRVAQASATCSPTIPGHYSVSIEVTDMNGFVAASPATALVVNPPAPLGAPAFETGSFALYAVAAGSIGVAVVATLVFRARKHR